MVDRKARDAMADEIECYLRDETTDSELDKALRETIAASSDQTLKVVLDHTWDDDDDWSSGHVVAVSGLREPVILRHRRLASQGAKGENGLEAMDARLTEFRAVLREGRQND
jgi:hypothetical protein